jgi:putative tryptophan/tyrosine transport system substrate-binding protein
MERSRGQREGAVENPICRREFVSQLAAATTVAALGVPNASLAQAPSGKPKRVGVMMAIASGDPEGLGRVDVFRRALAEAGWTDGRNVTIEIGWYQGSLQIAQEVARDLVGRGVGVMLVNGTPGMDALQALRTDVPIVFVVVSNPVGAGYVSNLSRPGGNITGFSTFEPEITSKWLQLLRQIVPGLKNVSMLLDPKFTGFNSLWQAIAVVAPAHGIAAHAAHASTLEEIEQRLSEAAQRVTPGLIVAPSPINSVNRARLAALALEHKLPSVSPFRFYLREGALLTYGFSAIDQFRRAAGYIGRILAGEKPGNLPVQAPSVFELGINLKTAKAIGITIPQSLLITADEVIE